MCAKRTISLGNVKAIRNSQRPVDIRDKRHGEDGNCGAQTGLLLHLPASDARSIADAHFHRIRGRHGQGVNAEENLRHLERVHLESRAARPDTHLQRSTSQEESQVACRLRQLRAPRPRSAATGTERPLRGCRPKDALVGGAAGYT